ncbi:cell wall metabolism sensor histidine kinase WalK [Paenibacillus sp. CF384]|uniref:sensor histidine kinase n=1 Tax=Paenibacillus sp. CF384 TaxID=1884382 RepID=UPI00089D7389|nr:sensor histidine kinase [Paenibacillus sp. CF384]SDW66147.1 Signal transduction histidine kinase [Paenibacillus sp. CF384]
MKRGRSVAFKLFTVTAVVFIAFTTLMMVLQLTFFESYYEKQKIKAIKQEFTELRDKYMVVGDTMPSGAGTGTRAGMSRPVPGTDGSAEGQTVEGGAVLRVKSGSESQADTGNMAKETSPSTSPATPLLEGDESVNRQPFIGDFTIPLPGQLQGETTTMGSGLPLYFAPFESRYFALTAKFEFDDQGIRAIAIGAGQKQKRIFISIDQLGGDVLRMIQNPLSQEQVDNLMTGVAQWLQDSAQVERVFTGGETVVYRAPGFGPEKVGNNQLIAVAALPSADGARQVLFAVSSLQPVSDAGYVFKDFYMYFYGLAVVLILLLSFLYSGMITKPLRRLNQVALRLSKLDFSVKSGIKRNDEIGSLSRTFDFLSDNLQHALGELQAANVQLKEEFEKEKQLEAMRREFVAGVSHELKTPISLISGYAEGLRDGIGGAEKREQYLGVIMDETSRMSGLVNDMLDLAQLESGKYRLVSGSFDLRACAHAFLQRHAEPLERKAIALNALLPEEPAEMPAYGDRFRLEQVLANLMSNAIRHTVQGGAIELRIVAEPDRWLLSLWNEGEAIPEAELKRIWEQFYRTDHSRSRELGGTGIGLAIVKHILLLHGSTFGVRNHGSGVEFYFTVAKAEMDEA